MNKIRQRLEQDLAERLLNDLGADPDVAAVAEWARERFERIDALNAMLAEFDLRYQKALGEDDRRRAILELARLLGASQRQLNDDARAFSRYFDRDAVVERGRRRIGHEERAAVFGLARLSEFGEAMLQSRAGLRAVQRAMEYKRDERLREAAFRCIRKALERSANPLLGEEELWTAQRAALQTTETAWVQGEALTILSLAAATSAIEIVGRRLASPEPGDDLFVRRHAVRLIASSPAFNDHRSGLLERAAGDPSPAVRQAVAEAVWRGTQDEVAHLVGKLARDTDAKVRATLLLGCHSRAGSGLPILVAALEGEEDPFVIRTALHVATSWAWSLEPAGAADLAAKLGPAILRLCSDHPQRRVRAFAAAAAEQLWCAGLADARSLVERIRQAAARTKEGRTFSLPVGAGEQRPDRDLLGRVLAVLAQDGFGLEVLDDGRIRHGELLAFRSWRALHEWRNPNSDKRQAFPHWIGRVWRGRTIAPSRIMAELAPTKVPGEPLFQPDDGDWRPWLPLPDMILSAIDTGETVTLYTAEGCTDIEPPQGLLPRLRARLELTRGFAALAALRNWTVASGRPPSSYAESIGKLGVRLRLRPYPDRQLDKEAVRFFSVAPAALLAVPAFWQQVELYFSSLYANDLTHLAVFLLLAAGWFFLNHWLRNWGMQKARASLPLVVGGWGTRGKSGTERLKAAVFSALGHPLISKTTGNEAMFLHSAPFGEVREMFLFRPYDKATIWEQLNLAILSQKLGAKIFLWECMGLTPSYVKVLQRHWMQDDIATITNTYPDHEDVQGPAGRNIPEVMTNFIPENSTLITSEEQMRPILVEAARELETSFEAVGWLEAGLIPDVFLSRFPYEEHPYNIALVTAMARRLDIEPDVAVKEMADRVVQDIGALKVYPEAQVRGRRLEFVLGNSANERFGALGNWTRLGFDRHNPVEEPDLWITTVINNRADRVPRSRVFASILVKDISADRHVLIGSNLEGLQGFIAESWAELAPTLTLSPPEQPDTPALAVLEGMARRFRVVHREDQLQSILGAMERVGRKDDETANKHAERCRAQLAEYQALAAEVRDRGASPELDQRLRDQLWRWFQDKIVVVEDYHATGEQIVRQLADLTPPGFRNRIMGMQNIKGTGLDFVYRWHAWEAVERACSDALSEDPGRQDRGLQLLASFREYGVLSREAVQDMLQELRERPGTRGELAGGKLDLIEARVNEQLALLDSKSQESDGGGGGKWIARLEALLDAGDAVRRRKQADRIYKELAAERISSDRAVTELKRLTSRQKGGWLAKDLRERKLLR